MTGVTDFDKDHFDHLLERSHVQRQKTPGSGIPFCWIARCPTRDAWKGRRMCDQPLNMKGIEVLINVVSSGPSRESSDHYSLFRSWK
jgi:hypothetical protein